MKKIVVSLSLSLAAFAFAQDLTSIGNDPAYPTQLFFVGVGSSPISQADADNLAVSQIQKQITVTVKVAQESGVSNKQSTGNKESISRWLDSRATMSSRGDLQGADIVKRQTQGKTFIAVAALNKAKFAAAKRLNMAEAGKGIKTLADQAKTDVDAGKLADALGVRTQLEERIRTFESERILLSAAEALQLSDTVPANLDAINKMYEVALKKLSLTAAAGNDQALTDVAQPLQPWIVNVTAEGKPIPEMPVKLVAPDRKIVRTAVTDAQGNATFFPDGFAYRASGTQTYTAMADLNVNRSQVDILERKKADFRYTVTPPECKVKMQFSGIDVAAAKTELTKTLMNYGFKDDPTAKKTLTATTTATQKGYSQGLSEASSFSMMEVALTLAVLDPAGRTVQSSITKAVGAGNKDNAIVSAIKKMDLGPDASALSKAACGAGVATKDLPTLAILPFSAPRAWYSDEAKAGMLADMVAGAVHRMEAYQIVERTRLNEIVSEQTSGQTGLMANPVEMGQLLGAQFVMMGTVLSDNGTFKVEGKIVDTKTGALVKTFSAAGTLEQIADQIAKQVI